MVTTANAQEEGLFKIQKN